jgi:SAM-dependent methyltransferase
MASLRAILRRLVRTLFLTSNTIRYRVELPRLREALAKIGKVDFALDVGAGSGFYAAEAYLPISEQLCAIEFDPVLCKILAEELARFGSRVHWLQGSILDLPFGSAEFDLVSCSQVLEHIADEGRAADELARVIRPGGHLLILVPHPPAPWPEGDHVREGYTSSGLESLFAARGLALRHTDYFLTGPTQRTIRLTHRLWERLPALLPLPELRMDAQERRAASPYGLLALFQRQRHPF